jgi:hypothetical protein
MSLSILRSLCPYLIYVIILLSSYAVSAQQLPKAIDLYVRAWNESNHEDRMAILSSFWREESIYEDPGSYAKGKAALKNIIESFWKDFPGATFEMGPVLSKGSFHTWEWKIFDSKNALMLTGVDFAETNAADQMLHLVGFWYPPQKNLAESNINLVKIYFESLFKKQDFATIEKIISEDAVYHQAAGLPYGGTYKGFAEWMKMITKVTGYVDLQIEEEPQYFTNEDKNTVMMRFTIQCTSKKSGQKISMPLSEQFELKDSRIISIQPFYFDTNAFAAFLKQ